MEPATGHGFAAPGDALDKSRIALKRRPHPAAVWRGPTPGPSAAPASFISSNEQHVRCTPQRGTAASRATAGRLIEARNLSCDFQEARPRVAAGRVSDQSSIDRLGADEVSIRPTSGFEAAAMRLGARATAGRALTSLVDAASRFPGCSVRSPTADRDAG